MRRLIVISGSLGVGKSAVAEKLFYSIPNSGWLDPDQTWWSMRPEEDWETAIPFILDNTIHCINNYIRYGLDPIMVSWFFPETDQIRFVHDNLQETTTLRHYLLLADRETLIQRHSERGDRREYADWMFIGTDQVMLDTTVLDTDSKTVDQVIDVILGYEGAHYQQLRLPNE